jgi:hypothetical protein
MLKKILAAVGAVALTLGLVALVAGPASAHNHTVDASCAAGVSVNLTNYATGTPNGNHVTVWVDNTTTPVKDVNFGGSFVQTFPFASGSATHSYRVKVWAYDDQQYSFDTGVKTITGCTESVTAAAASKSDPVCQSAGVYGGGGYTIPTEQTGVQYQVENSSAQWVDTAAGTYPAAPGAVIHIRAVPSSSAYTLSGTTTWDFTLTNPDASHCVVPVAPHASPAACVSGGPGQSTTASYTIVPTTGVVYKLNDGTVVTGTVTVTSFPATIVINATPVGSYVFPANATRSWTFTFASAGECLVTVTPAAVTPQQSVCEGPGSSSTNGYTVTQTGGVVYQVKSGDSWVTITAYGFTDLGKGASTVQIRAVADTGYALSGTQSWSFTFTSAGTCLQQTTVPDPTFVNTQCDASHPGQSTLGSYEVLTGDHVTFQVVVNGAAPVAISKGTVYSANPGDVVTILVTPDTGYTIFPVLDSTKFTFNYATPGLCLVNTVPVTPKATSQTCLTSDGQLPDPGQPAILTDAYLTIPSTVGIAYYINGSRVAASTNQQPQDIVEQPGIYRVTALALTGYALDPSYPTDGWSFTLTSAEPCGQLITHPLVSPAATQVQLGCFAGGSYTLSNDLSDPAAILWTVNGSAVSQGTYKVTTASTVKVHAEANGPSYGLESGAQQDWTFVFQQPTSCDLTTLALTGSSPTGWIALGYLMLVSGLGLIAVRFVRRRGEQA